MKKASPSSVFDSDEISQLVGITHVYLNKFVERGSYGIRPSVKSGEGRGKRRLFSFDDAFGIALVWWLFESGLRSGAIQYVLNQVSGGRRQSKANDAATALLEKKVKMLAILRKPRSAKETYSKYPSQSVEFFNESDPSQILPEHLTVSTLVLPVGDFFAQLKIAMQTR